MFFRARSVCRTWLMLSLGLMVSTMGFAKSSSSSSSAHASSSASTPSHSSATTIKSTKSTINLSKSVASTKPMVSLAKPNVTLAKPIVIASTSSPSVTRTVTNTPVVVPTTSVSTGGLALHNNRTSTSTSSWFGGSYEVFDRPGINATRVYRSDSAFSTARWLLDHKAYHVPHLANTGYELRTSGQVLDMGTPDLDRWIEAHR